LRKAYLIAHAVPLFGYGASYGCDPLPILEPRPFKAGCVLVLSDILNVAWTAWNYEPKILADRLFTKGSDKIPITRILIYVNS
jgi:hypothetical protein